MALHDIIERAGPLKFGHVQAPGISRLQNRAKLSLEVRLEWPPLERFTLIPAYAVIRAISPG